MLSEDAIVNQRRKYDSIVSYEDGVPSKPLSHTIENLCPEERVRVAAMVERLDKLRSCAHKLEKELDFLRKDNKRLEGENTVLSEGLKERQSKLRESLEVMRRKKEEFDKASDQWERAVEGRKDVASQLTEVRGKIEELKAAKEAQIEKVKGYPHKGVQVDRARVDVGVDSLQVVARDYHDVSVSVVLAEASKETGTDECGLGYESLIDDDTLSAMAALNGSHDPAVTGICRHLVKGEIE